MFISNPYIMHMYSIQLCRSLMSASVLVVWISDNTLVLINMVALHRVWLVLVWVPGNHLRVNHLGM